ADAVFQSLAAGATTTVTVNYTVSDGVAAPVSTSASWTVTGVNDAPVVSGAVTGTATQGGAVVTLDALAHTTDVDTATLSVTAPAGLPAGVTYDQAAKTFTLDPTNSAYSTLTSGQSTTVTVNYTVSDGVAAPVSTSAVWTVNGPQAIASTDGGTVTLGSLGTYYDSATGTTFTRSSTKMIIDFPSANWQDLHITYTSNNVNSNTLTKNSANGFTTADGILTKNSNTKVTINLASSVAYKLTVNYNGRSNGTFFLIPAV
ncbi:MAG: cadherin-like domain-containing protein, partial [Mycobacterium sp.]